MPLNVRWSARANADIAALNGRGFTNNHMNQLQRDVRAWIAQNYANWPLNRRQRTTIPSRYPVHTEATRVSGEIVEVNECHP
jgi:hypothetical protein